MKNFKKTLFLWLPVLIWAGILFYLSSVQNLKAASDPQLDEVIRSFIHFLFYAVLYILIFRAVNFGKGVKDRLNPFLLAGLYGFFDELHQFFVPTRTPQLRDVITDLGGAAFGGLVVWNMLPKMPRRLRNLAKKLGVI